jgi:HEAT repeat protein
MRNSESASTSVRVFLLLGLALVLAVGAALWFMDWGPSSLPGKDVHRFEAGAVARHVEALKSPEAATRAEAATDLWQIGDAAREATPALIQAAMDADPAVRAAAVKALGRAGEDSQEAMAALIQAFQDEQTEVRIAAAISLAEAWRIAGKGASQARSSPVGAGGRARSSGAAPAAAPGELLPAYQPLARKAIPLLTAALHDADLRIRTHAAEALAETGTLAEPAVPDLVHLLETEPDQEARLQATLALCSIGPGAKAAVPVLVGKLRTEKEVGLRVNTADALGKIKSNPELVVPALMETFLTDEEPEVRRCAMASIGRFGSQAKVAIPLLEKAAKDPKNQQSPDKLRTINRLLEYIQKAARAAPKEGRGEASPAAPQSPPK